MPEIKKEVQLLRNNRIYHRWLGIILGLFILISAGTGILLSVKKEFAILQPPTQKGVQKDLINTMPLEMIAFKADSAYQNINEAGNDNQIDRIDIRPTKGIAKVIYEHGNWEIQVDLHNGSIKSIEKRYSDWIESLHDGSIVGDYFKLFSMNVLGWGLILMLISGLWLYFGPKRVRRLRHKKNNTKPT